MLKKQTADDDSESQKRTDIQSPEVCVDYLSYTFDEMDLAASWRMMTKQKKDIVNGIRLENASWRTWAKQRNHLKTISPETLNWLKDSDVTWLYGPLHTVTKTEQEDRYAPKESSAHDKFGLIHASDAPLIDKGITGTPSAPPLSSSTVTRTTSNTTNTAIATTNPPSTSILPTTQQRPLKSALKKVTMSDILRRSASEFHVSDLNETGGSGISLSEANRQLGAFSPSVIATHRQPKLRFNQRVEQYMVISDDDGGSATGSLPKVKMTANLSSRYYVSSSDRADTTGTTTDDNHSDSQDDDYPTHRRRNGNQYHHRRHTHYSNSDDSNNDEKEYSENDADNDDDEDDDDGIMMQHHSYDNNRKNISTPRSIKRIEPAVLKSSSYSDNSVTSVSRRDSLSSWDDDDDRKSIHLPDYQLHRQTTNTSNQSIQWEGQSSIVYDVSPSEPESDYVDDDWDLHRQSFDDSNSNMEYDNDDEPTNQQYTTSVRMDIPSSSSSSNQVVSNTSFSPPIILSPGKASKSQPISEPSTVDAIHHQTSNINNDNNNNNNNNNNNTNKVTTDSHDRMLEQQSSASSHSVFGHLGQWATSYFWKS
ncbi:uncharacterized protein BX664DRAFT_388209 [Halteromyces radiatus]|uniref:uncharacterized protein n=1 Tax=Halteromyces radiatus TaxID=101107 RepID=UPI00221E7B12|nr:uncharacterized protein BX664DRAFT_388209 [Halteromyces radiatus]KAI8083113.1 hypothetical protein BX664DRAFT_388209 [Halteromyces radiatus]